MAQKEDKRKLLLNYERRLQRLEEKKAILGLEAPVSLTIEIEDIREKIAELWRELEELEKKVDRDVEDLNNRVTNLENGDGKSNNYWLWIGIGAGVLVLLFVVGGAIVYQGMPVESPTPTVTPWSPVNDDFTYTDPNHICSIDVSQASQAGRANAIKITFDIPDQKGYCGWGIRLNNYDASNKTMLTFWVKGENGGEQFMVSILDSITTPGQEPKVMQTASTTWQQISIPLEEFGTQDFSSLENLGLNFEYGLEKGAIYVADFIFDGDIP